MSNQLLLLKKLEISAHLTSFVNLCLALVAVSFAPIFIRFSETDLGANGTVFNRLWIFALVFGLGQWVNRQVLANREERLEAAAAEPVKTVWQWVLLGGVGVISIFSLGLWALSLQYTSVAKSMLLNNLTPIFTTLGSWLFLHRGFDKPFLIGMTIALSGAIAIGLEDIHGVDGFLIGDFYALLSAVFLAAYFLMVEQLRKHFSATTILLWRCVVGSILLLPIVWVTEGQLLPTTMTAWLAVLGLGLVSEGLGQRLLADSMEKFSSSFISVFLLLEPILSAILAWVIFVEKMSLTTWLGFAVILTGIYIAKSSSSSEVNAGEAE